jgi:miniconductance mechanosensitive channel
VDVLSEWLVGRGWSQGWASITTIGAALLVAYSISWVVRLRTPEPLRRLLGNSKAWSEVLERLGVIRRGASMVFIIVTRFLALPLLEAWPALQVPAGVLLDALLVFVTARTASALISAVVEILGREADLDQRLPFTFLGQALQLVVWTLASIVLLSVVTQREVASVIAGMTAVGAVLAYVFRDPILGWTAGMQLAANDSVKIGDWIVMRDLQVDGIVEDIALTTVKVRNWDKTISSIPTHALVSQGLRNYRGMYQSGGRRIVRAISIDATSVCFPDDRLLERLRQSPLTRDLVESIEPGPTTEKERDPLSQALPTNLLYFRRWLEAWLEQHPQINHEMTTLVREREPEGRGIPVEIYAFSRDQQWEAYELLQAAILDQVVATLPAFDLRLFQEPTGEDLRSRSRPI